MIGCCYILEESIVSDSILLSHSFFGHGADVQACADRHRGTDVERTGRSSNRKRTRGDVAAVEADM